MNLWRLNKLEVSRRPYTARYKPSPQTFLLMRTRTSPLAPSPHASISRDNPGISLTSQKQITHSPWILPTIRKSVRSAQFEFRSCPASAAELGTNQGMGERAVRLSGSVVSIGCGLRRVENKRRMGYSQMLEIWTREKEWDLVRCVRQEGIELGLEDYEAAGNSPSK